VVLHPVRRRPAERVLASWLHPLPARGRDRRRDPDLARWPRDGSAAVAAG